MEIDGKVAVIVGGASGMARSTAEMLLARGARIAICDLATSSGSKVASEMGKGTTFHAVDVTDFSGVESVLAEVAEKHGALHIAVNTAGGGIARRTLYVPTASVGMVAGVACEVS